MYRHSPVRNQRSKGIKIKHVLQVCLLVAVCFWLIFQVKRSHDKKKEFDANEPKISLNTRADEIVKFGRKNLQPKLEEKTTGIEMHEDTQEDEDEQEEHEENKHEEEEQDEDKIDEEKDDGGGGGDDEIDESEQEKSNMEIDRDEVEIIDEDKETEESEDKETEESEDKETEEREHKENEEKDGQSQTENGVDHDEDGSTEHTHEAREEHYKADDASSAVITHDAENEIKNGTLDNNLRENNGTIIQQKETESIDFHENGPPSNTTMMTSDSTEAQNVTVSGEQAANSSPLATSNATLTETTQGSSNSTNISEVLKLNESTAEENSSDPSKNENLDTNNALDPDEVQHETIDSIDPTHLEEKEVRNDLETLPEIETEGGNSEDTAVE